MKKHLTLLSLCISASAFAQIQGDINFNSFYSHTHDSTICATFIDVNSMVDISNSFMGDSVKFISGWGSTLYEEENTTGSAFWNVNFPYAQNWVESDDMISGNVLSTFVPGDIYKVISGPDTLYVNGTFFSEPIPDACAYNNVSGQIYIDANTDCSFGTGDSAISSVYATSVGNYINTPLLGTSSNGYSNVSGNYSINIQESWLNSYTVSIPSIYQFIFPYNSCSATSYSFTTLPQTGVDFSLECAGLDTRVYAGHSGNVRPALPFYMFPSVSNIGCAEVSGTLKLKLDANVTYNAANSSNPADAINGDTLIWNYSDLTNVGNGIGYWNSIMGGIELTPSLSVNIGDTLCFEISTDIPAGDVNTGNNAYSFCLPVVNSYDPNIKEVMPAGEGAEGYIASATEKLTYTIHFQNTGTADAINVNIIDTLGANVLPNTMHILDASHAMTPEWLNSNTIKFKFNNINLPDSNNNEPLSHGYVRFEVDMVQGLNPGTEIKNKAEIYFDFNSAIVTPYAINTIETPSSASINSISNNLNVTAYPNPTHDLVNFTISDAIGSVAVSLTDLSGKIVYSKNEISNSKVAIDVSNLSNGIYLYKVLEESSNHYTIGKLIVE
jgi:uncharacterized repeat protein (TIGR01451 family)